VGFSADPMVRETMLKIALLFPGQGSQYVGMGKELFLSSSPARETFDEADDTLGFKLSSLCFEGPKERLNQTDVTQPAILAVGIATFRTLLAHFPVRPAFLAGHSLGEYSALVVSGALSFPDALRLVSLRGLYMQEAVPEGKGLMAAIMGLQKSVVDDLCRDVTEGEEIVVPANYNTAQQIVISGSKCAVERAAGLAEERGAKKVVILKVSVPSHSPLMISAGKRLAKNLEGIEIDEMNIPVVTNLEATPLTDSKRVGDILVKQLSNPVRWEDSILKMREEGIDFFIEMGPGRVLTGLNKRICRDVKTLSFESLDDLESLEKL
jgi:[acyl-carrier-protein] S-malonyltransferase